MTRQERFAFLATWANYSHQNVMDACGFSQSSANNHLNNVLEPGHLANGIQSRPIKFKYFNRLCRAVGLRDAPDVQFCYSSPIESEQVLKGWIEERIAQPGQPIEDDDLQRLSNLGIKLRPRWPDIYFGSFQAELEKLSLTPPANTLVGRSSLLKRLEAHLCHPDRNPGAAYLTGPMGIGKTAVAASCCMTLKVQFEQHAKKLAHIFSFDCKEDPDADIIKNKIFDAMFVVDSGVAPRLLRDNMNDAISIGLRKRPAIIVLDNFEYVQDTQRTESEDFGRARRPFPTLIGVLTEPQCLSRLLICSQISWPEFEATCGRRACRSEEIPELNADEKLSLLVKLFRDHKIDIDADLARRISTRCDGSPLHLICTAAAGASTEDPVSTLVTTSSEAGRTIGDSYFLRFKDRQTALSLMVLRLVALSNGAMPVDVLLKLLKACAHYANPSFDPKATVEAALIANPSVLTAIGPDSSTGYQRSIAMGEQFKWFLRLDWEHGDESQNARSMHRLLAQYFFLAGCTEHGLVVASREFPAWQDVTFAPPADRSRAPSSVLRGVKLFQASLNHALASLAPQGDGLPIPAALALTVKDAGGALSVDAPARLVAMFAFEVLYMQCIERNDPKGQKHWFLSRTLGASDEKAHILCRFLSPGSSFIDLKTLIATPAMLPPLLPRSSQAEILRSIGISAVGLNYKALAERALDHAQSQYIQLNDDLQASKVLKTRIDMLVLQGRLTEASNQLSDAFEIFLGRKLGPADLAGFLELLSIEKLSIARQLLGRIAHCTYLGDQRSVNAIELFQACELCLQWLQRSRGDSTAVLDGNIGRRYVQALLRLNRTDEALSRTSAALSELGRHKDVPEQVRLARRIDLASALRSSGNREGLVEIIQVVSKEEDLAANLSASFEAFIELFRCYSVFGRGRKVAIRGEEQRVDTLLAQQLLRARRRGAVLFACDLHLIAAEIGAGQDAADHIAQARAIIESTGYKLRTTDLHMLEANQKPSKVFGA